MILALLLALALKGDMISESLVTFQDKHIESFCAKETDSMIICENDEDSFAQNRAYSRAEFQDKKLVRLDYVIDAGEKVAKKIAVSLEKQYGNPASETDLPDSFSRIWSDEHTELSLAYSSAVDNGLGHPKIRVYISVVKQN